MVELYFNDTVIHRQGVDRIGKRLGTRIVTDGRDRCDDIKACGSGLVAGRCLDIVVTAVSGHRLTIHNLEVVRARKRLAKVSHGQIAGDMHERAVQDLRIASERKEFGPGNMRL